jgi:hypothetical protein
MSVGKPFSEPYGTHEALRQPAAVWNEGPPMEHFGAQLEADRLDVLPCWRRSPSVRASPDVPSPVPLAPATSPPQLDSGGNARDRE